ncbi:hypothetical protein METP3_01766 [Methanosarcinales archaeon]|nr:hypothetical protein METP3_01766 [Methanosarcinales archaeon]
MSLKVFVHLSKTLLLLLPAESDSIPLVFLSFSLIISVVITAEAMNASSGFPK